MAEHRSQHVRRKFYGQGWPRFGNSRFRLPAFQAALVLDGGKPRVKGAQGVRSNILAINRGSVSPQSAAAAGDGRIYRGRRAG